ncbi:MAG: hypothetical protein IJZ36_03805 [Bacilli bacterium]|nr:hypothetical protein [Bacilli bacterium]
MEDLNIKIELIKKLLNHNMKLYVVSNNYMKRKYIYDKLNYIYNVYSIDNIKNKEHYDIIICDTIYMDNILKNNIDLYTCFIMIDNKKDNKNKIKILK